MPAIEMNKHLIEPPPPIVEKGMLVKINDGTERFWVLVTSVRQDKIFGKVDNHLDHTDKPWAAHGTSIVFHRKFISEIGHVL